MARIVGNIRQFDESADQSTLIVVDLTSDINKRSELSPGFTWLVHVMERVPDIWYTQCISAIMTEDYNDFL